MQQAQGFVGLLQLPGFFGHSVFKVAIQGGQLFRHVIDGVSQQPQFIFMGVGDAGTEITFLQLSHSIRELAQRGDPFAVHHHQ